MTYDGPLQRQRCRVAAPQWCAPPPSPREIEGPGQRPPALREPRPRNGLRGSQHTTTQKRLAGTAALCHALCHGAAAAQMACSEQSSGESDLQGRPDRSGAHHLPGRATVASSSEVVGAETELQCSPGHSPNRAHEPGEFQQDVGLKEVLPVTGKAAVVPRCSHILLSSRKAFLCMPLRANLLNLKHISLTDGDVHATTRCSCHEGVTWVTITREDPAAETGVGLSLSPPHR